MIDMEELKRLLSDPEIVNQHREKLRKEKEVEDGQYSRVLQYIVNLSPTQAEEKLLNFLKWEEKYEEFHYKHRQTLTESILLYNVFEILQRVYGTEVEIGDEDFCADRFEWSGYIFSLFVGQGSFWRVEKDGKLIFQSI